VLGPVRSWPFLLRQLHKFIVDKWRTVDRLGNIVRHTRTRLRLNIIHAKDDADIPWTEDNKMFRAAANETVGILDDAEFDAWKEQRTVRKGDDSFVTTWKADPDIIIRQELFPYGGTYQNNFSSIYEITAAESGYLGHNEIMRHAPVTLAIMRSFDLYGTTYSATD
jgi:abhydrolase domain-containing protein 12